MSKQVVVYHTAGCSSCSAAMSYLSRRGVKFTSRDIAHEPQALEEFKRLKADSTPAIVVDGKVIVGFDQKQLDAALA